MTQATINRRRALAVAATFPLPQLSACMSADMGEDAESKLPTMRGGAIVKQARTYGRDWAQ